MFDEPRFNEMQHFLMRLYQIGRENLNVQIDKNLVRHELRKYELSSGDVKYDGNYVECKELFKKWIERNKKVQGLTILYELDWPYFLQFYSTGDRKYFDENPYYIKLYIPMKQKKLFESVNILFDYINNSKIKHESKVADKIRTDNVIIRLINDDIDSALKIIDFVNKDKIIKNNLNKTNPFVPTINGIGFMYETGISYNEELATLIAHYITMCIEKRHAPVLSDFYRWFKENNQSIEVNNIFAYAIGEKNTINIKDINEQREQSKYQLLTEAIKATFLKYDIFQAICALKMLIEEGNYGYFTNGTGEIAYRDCLKTTVTMDDAIRYVKTTLNKSGYLVDDDIIEFCQNVLIKNVLNEFCEACYITYMNYDKEQLESALKSKIYKNDSSEFSRFSKRDVNRKKNYRDIIEKYDRNNIINLMKLFLQIRAVDYEKSEVDEIIELYSSSITSFDYHDDSEKGKTI